MTEVEVYHRIYDEEKAKIPNRKTMHADSIMRTALPTTIIRFVKHLLEEKGEPNDRPNTSSDKDRNPPSDAGSVGSRKRGQRGYDHSKSIAHAGTVKAGSK